LSPVGVGDPLPAVTLPRLGGGEVTIPVAGKPTLLLFTKSSCPTCTWAAPLFRELHERLGGSSLAVVAVAQDDEDAESEFAREHRLGYPVALESSPWRLAADLGLTTVPTAVYVDADGRCGLVSPGFARDDLVGVAERVAAHDGTGPRAPFAAGDDVPAFRPG